MQQRIHQCPLSLKSCRPPGSRSCSSEGHSTTLERVQYEQTNVMQWVYLEKMALEQILDNLQSQLTALGDIHSSFETCTRPNASVRNPENTVARYGSTEAVTTYTDIYEEQDTNAEAYLERSIPAQAVECLKSMKLGHQERDFVGFGHQRLNNYYQTLPMHKHSEKHP
jgi:hypothetical protein